MTPHIKHLALAALAACAVPATAQSPSPQTLQALSVTDASLRDEPVIFSVTDADSEVILYPTVHALPQGFALDSDILSAALARADEVWFEIAPDAMDDPGTAMMMFGMGTSDIPLRERLTDAQTTALAADLDALGMPLAALDPLDPWFAALAVATKIMAEAGFDPARGAEAQLVARIGDTPTRALETPEQQARFFENMPVAAQIDFLITSVEDAGEGVALLDRLAELWAGGDLNLFESEFLDEMRADTPGLYDALLVARNADWAEQLDAELQGTGTDFVAVGGLHLVGPDSVQALLAQKGYEVSVLTLK